MNQNSLNGLFLPAIAAFFLFGKKAKHQETKIVHRIYAGDPNGLSGVAKYLQGQEKELLAKQELQALQVSGVAKYLEAREQQFPLTSVDKYALRQALAEKQAEKNSPVTGVDKYLKNRKPAPSLSGVEKYLKHQESLPQPSKVAKYLAKQALVGRQPATDQTSVTGVAKYLQHQDSLPQPSRVAKYLAKQAALFALQPKPTLAEPKATGVAKYLQHQDTLPQPSRVAKYLARQALAEQQKPVAVETGVEKYVRDQQG